MIFFCQTSGGIWLAGALLCEFPLSYSGHGAGLGNPRLESLHGIGPIPAGRWRIAHWYDHPHLGPCVAELIPSYDSLHGGLAWTFDRSAFRIHGDNPHLNHTASDGCIIVPHSPREQLRASGDSYLQVIHLPSDLPSGARLHA